MPLGLETPDESGAIQNAIAHFNIRFIGDGQNEISFLKVWNEDRGRKTWEAELSVGDLRGIAERLSKLLLDEADAT